MLNPWFSFGLASARRGLEAQSAFVASLLRMGGGGPLELPGPIHNGEQIDRAVPQPPPATVPVPAARRAKAAKRSPEKDPIIELKTRQAPKRAAAASSKRPAKTLRPGRKGR
jgi:hypothetical protein